MEYSTDFVLKQAPICQFMTLMWWCQIGIIPMPFDNRICEQFATLRHHDLLANRTVAHRYYRCRGPIARPNVLGGELRHCV